MRARGLGRWPVVCLVVCALACAVTNGLGAETGSTERARIQRERAAAQSAFEARERECRSRFVVTSCVEEARREQREVLGRLRRQEALIEEDQRRERAAQRVGSSRPRPGANDAGAADGKAAADGAASAPRKERKPLTVRAPERKHGPRPAKVVPGETLAAEARSQAKFEAAQRSSRERREAVERRNVQRAAGSKGAAPLPAPAGASAP